MINELVESVKITPAGAVVYTGCPQIDKEEKTVLLHVLVHTSD